MHLGRHPRPAAPPPQSLPEWPPSVVRALLVVVQEVGWAENPPVHGHATVTASDSVLPAAPAAQAPLGLWLLCLPAHSQARAHAEILPGAHSVQEMLCTAGAGWATGQARRVLSAGGHMEAPVSTSLPPAAQVVRVPLRLRLLCLRVHRWSAAYAAMRPAMALCASGAQWAAWQAWQVLQGTLPSQLHSWAQ